VNVIQYYQTILYKSLGVSPRVRVNWLSSVSASTLTSSLFQMILVLAGVYGTLAFTSNAITTRFLTDNWGRRPMILTGLSGIILIEIYASVMQLEFQTSHNQVGKGFALLGVFLFVVCYSKCCSSPMHHKTVFSRTDLSRRHAELHHLALRRRSPPYQLEK